MGTRTASIEGTFHLGSQCPVDPTTTAIYDFVPRKLLSKVINLVDLGSAFVLDTWLGQTDSRQAIFVRERASSNDLELRLYLIDHGMSFAGTQWEPHSPPCGLYIDRGVYSLLDMKATCERILSRIETLVETDLYAAATDIPSCWFADSDYDQLAKLLVVVERGRNRLRSVISHYLEALEPEWSAHSPRRIPNSMKED
jgi:hypothetical protein